MSTKFYVVILGSAGSLLNLGCQHSVTINSAPAGAAVHAELPSGDLGPPLGKTPFETKFSPSDHVANFRIVLDGYESLSVLLPISAGANTNVSLKLQKIDEIWFTEKYQSSQSKSLSALMGEMLKLQNAVIESNYAEVDKLVVTMRPRFEKVSIWQSLVGNSYLLRGNKNEARKYYQKALELDPQNFEAKQFFIYYP